MPLRQQKSLPKCFVIKRTTEMTNFLAVWMTIAYLVQSTLSINNINNIQHLETKLTQELNVAITFCVENPTACKTEYLKLK